MTSIVQDLQEQKRRRAKKVIAATLLFLIIALAAYLVLLGQGAVKMSPIRPLEVLNGAAQPVR